MYKGYIDMHLYEESEQGLDIWSKDALVYNLKKFKCDTRILDQNFEEDADYLGAKDLVRGIPSGNKVSDDQGFDGKVKNKGKFRDVYASINVPIQDREERIIEVEDEDEIKKAGELY